MVSGLARVAAATARVEATSATGGSAAAGCARAAAAKAISKVIA